MFRFDCCVFYFFFSSFRCYSLSLSQGVKLINMCFSRTPNSFITYIHQKVMLHLCGRSMRFAPKIRTIQSEANHCETDTNDKWMWMDVVRFHHLDGIYVFFFFGTKGHRAESIFFFLRIFKVDFFLYFVGKFSLSSFVMGNCQFLIYNGQKSKGSTFFVCH